MFRGEGDGWSFFEKSLTLCYPAAYLDSGWLIQMRVVKTFFLSGRCHKPRLCQFYNSNRSQPPFHQQAIGGANTRQVMGTGALRPFEWDWELRAFSFSGRCYERKGETKERGRNCDCQNELLVGGLSV